MKAYLGLGSNLGDRLSHLESAALSLRKVKGVSDLRASPVIESAALVPAGSPVEWQMPFLNAVIEIQCTLSPHALLEELKAIEAAMGRTNLARWAPRPIDLDILLFGDQIFKSDRLTIPHTEMFQRSFVLEPLKHLNPEVRVLTSARRLKDHHPLWMGIVNLSPDSFSGDFLAHFQSTLNAASQTQIWDFGGESTRPGAHLVSADLEWQRLKPALDHFHAMNHGRIFRPWLSVDTHHASTAARAIEQGADMINDVSGLADPEMLNVIGAGTVQYVLMHSLTVPADPRRVLPEGSDPVTEVKRWAEAKLEVLEKNGIALSRVIFDPGLGFGKTARQSLVLLQRFEEFHSLPVRLLIGHSRKSFLKHWHSGEAPERDPESLGLSLSLAARGCDIIRVHRPEWHQRAFTAFQGAKA